MAKRDLVTSTDYEHPYRPVPVRLFNLIGRSIGVLGLSGPLEVDALVRQAKRKTGLTDFGDDGHLLALETLVESINREARLTSMGRLIQKSRLASALTHRLRIEDLFRRHPEIHEIDLGKIVLITGLQRTGTTLLQRLLNVLPGVRGVSAAEALDPVPAGETNGRGESRKRRARLMQRAISYLSPQFAAVHPIDHNEPEEDVLLLDLNFMSQSAEAMMHVPSYSGWLEGQDQTRTYEYFRRVLKALCWQRPSKYWVLKTPHHMEHLDVFLKVFPEATVVQTHRDPRIAIASFCSMVAHGRGMLSDHVNPGEIGAHWFRKTNRMVHVTMQTRDDADPGRFVDVSYYDVTRDPMTELRRICAQAGIRFEDQAERKAEQYLRANPQHRFGKHAYRLEDFGLSREAVDGAFACYRERHAIPFE